MIQHLHAWADAHPYARWFYPVWAAASILLFFISPFTDNGFLWLYLGTAVLGLFAIRPGSGLYAVTMDDDSPRCRLFTCLAALVTALACTIPMGWFPLWNGEIPEHRNQYELMAEAFLGGHIDFAYGDEDALSQLKNPYDPAERNQSGVKFHWDHAFYNGHYYMYFGVVPVLLVFLPYRVLTGASLTTYHATQLFVAAAIAGIFILFRLLSRLFFKKLPYAVYLAASVAFSVMSVWYSISAPALYCTAITGAIALEIWSLYFFVRAVWGESRENRQLLLAGVGSVFGALTFGCRPPVALANILVLPMLFVFLRQRRITAKLLGKLALAALPYVLTAAALMVYNYVRFDDPFEFGQAYQLTVADQSQYSVHLDLASLRRIAANTKDYFFHVGSVQPPFPFLSAGSVFWNFPMLLLGAAVLAPRVWKNMRRARVLALTLGVYAAVGVITAMDILWTPYLLERYRMDIYFLMGIACFLTIGLWHDACAGKGRGWLAFVSVALSAATAVSSFLLCAAASSQYYPDAVKALGRLLHLA